ncbi:hypothetical protein TRVL_02326 [Trypanosoma vivax]|nr:hypothetical protein TRVL_02326 [Trypanosoma vivax]
MFPAPLSHFVPLVFYRRRTLLVLQCYFADWVMKRQWKVVSAAVYYKCVCGTLDVRASSFEVCACISWGNSSLTLPLSCRSSHFTGVPPIATTTTIIIKINLHIHTKMATHMIPHLR